MSRTAQDAAAESRGSIGDELPPGTELCGGQYVVQRFLNSGGFGITYLASDSLGRKVVIKECFPGAMCYRENRTVRLRSKGNAEDYQKILELFEKEALALSELAHPYIVGVHQIFKDNGTAYMALDYIEGRDLLQIIEEEPDRLTPQDVRQILKKLLDALAYIHERDILHRDISPDNILIESNNSPVLIDFGAARESATRVSRVLSKVLTVKDGYSPQEFYLAGTKHEYSSDLYALAATFHHLVSGTPPASSQLRLAAAAKNMQDPLEHLGTGIKGYEKPFLDAINTCLNIFPAERLKSAQQWLDIVDVERRRQILQQQVANDQQLTATISSIVSQSLKELGGKPTLGKKTQKAATAIAKLVPKKRPKMTLDELIAFEEGKKAPPRPAPELPPDMPPAVDLQDAVGLPAPVETKPAEDLPHAVEETALRRPTERKRSAIGRILSTQLSFLNRSPSKLMNQSKEVRE